MTDQRHKKLFSSYLMVLITAFLCYIFSISAYSVPFLYKSDSVQHSQEANEPFFHPIYVGNGVNHMNINLVELNLTGLKTGDEIGVFDGDYCVGAAVILEIDMQQNLFSIPASANDTLASSPNGFIYGHKIVLKAYRNGTVYPLFFELVDSSKDLFFEGGAMFAFVDFSKSTANELILSIEDLNVYPNPFNEQLKIELNLSTEKQVVCKIYNSSGKQVKLFPDNLLADHMIIVWDGRDDSGAKLLPGYYFLKLNNITKEIILLE